MSAPRLDHKLVLEAAVSQPDGAGGYVETWTALGTLWGEVRPRTGREATGVAGALSVAGFRITVRASRVGHPARPVAGQRFRQGARLFRVLAVTEREPGGQFLVCTAEEELAA